MTTTREINFSIIENYIRSKDYGILGTIDRNGFPHSSSVLYGCSEPSRPFCLYIVTDKSYKKVKNIEICNKVSFVIPYPHYILRFVPPNCIQFQGIAEILPLTDINAKTSFRKNRILRNTFDEAREDPDQNVMLKIIPRDTIFGFGLDCSINELRKNHSLGGFKSRVPKSRMEFKQNFNN